MNSSSASPVMTMSFQAILDRTFRIYRENFLPIVGYVALVTIPITLLNYLLARPMLTNLAATQTSRGTVSSGAVTASLLSSLVVIVLQILDLVLVYGVVSYVASESIFGQKVSIGTAFNAARSRFASLGCGIIVFYVVIIVLVIVVFFATAFCAPAIVGLAVVAYIGLATFALVTPVLVLENTRASTGINRAYGLGRARFWTILGVLAAIYVISLVLDLALSATLRLFGTPAFGNTLTGVSLLNTIASTAISILITPILPIAMTLIYYDARARVEGLDLALAAADKPNARPSDILSPAAAPFMTRRDLGNIAILAVAVVVLSLVAGGLLAGLINLIAPGFTLPR